MTQEPEDILDLQTRLRADPGGTERDRLLALLGATSRALKQRIDGGVAPAEFRTLTAAFEATQAAAEVIGLAWRRYQPGAA